MQNSESRAIRPFELLEQSFSQTFGPLYVPLLVLASPTLVIGILQGLFPGRTPQNPSSIATILGLINAFVLAPGIAGATILLVYRYLKQSTLDINDAISSTLPKLPQLILGMILYILIVMAGMICLIIPGIFLAIQLGFVLYEIAVEDCNAIEGLKNSWAIVQGRWWSILFSSIVILLIVGVPFLLVNFALGLGAGIVGAMMRSPSLAILLVTILSSILGLIVTPIFNMYFVNLYLRAKETA
jgi:hypothetical protein